MRTYQFGGMQGSKVQLRSESISTKERQPSKKPEGCANAIENGCVFKTEREVYFIMTAAVVAYSNRILTKYKAAGNRAVRPLCV